MDSARLLGSLTLLSLYLPICEMGEATPISWAFSKDHQVPMAMVPSPRRASAPNSLPPMGPRRGHRRLPKDRPGSTPSTSAWGLPENAGWEAEAAAPCNLVQTDPVPPRP